MTLTRWVVRVVCLAGGVFLSLVLLTFLAVQIQQRMLRWRAERLLADMHQIRLYQSTWADAQRLMHRWGAWGYYEGSCTAASCTYGIELRNSVSYNRHVPPAWLIWLLVHDRLNLYEWFGGRGSAFGASFTVHDGTIWRESTSMGISVPRRKIRSTDYRDWEWSLFVGAGSYQRLHQTLENPIMWGGGDESLARNPYYKVGRPSGCKILCEIVEVYYSTRTPPAEIKRLSSYDFSCFTRFHPCMRIVDLLPAAEEWHLYGSEYESGPTVPVPKERPLSEYSLPKPVPCSDIPVWAQARDAHYALAVEALSTKIVQDQETHQLYRKLTRVRVVDSLKGPAPAPWLPGAIVNADNREWFEKARLSGDLQLVPGRRYIVFPIGNDSKLDLVTKDSPLSFERCGVREDTPEVRREVEKGFAQNDTLTP